MAVKCSKFFKFLAPGFNTRLSLPVAFCSSLIENKMDKAVIKSCLGSWHVRVGRTVDGVLSFEEGWEEFVNHHGLKLGEILIFKHNGKRAFNVVAYEALGSEKRKKPSEATASSTSRTSFACTMKKSHGDPHKAYLTIPARFARSIGIVATSRIILKDPSGRSWPLILSRWESISRCSHRIANGWYKFYEANKLKNGDGCTFNLKPVSSNSGSKSARVMDVQITCG